MAIRRSIPGLLAILYERRTGPRKVALEAGLAPAPLWDPVFPGHAHGPQCDRLIRSHLDRGPLPARTGDTVFAPVTWVSGWIEQGKLSSERATDVDRAALRTPKDVVMVPVELGIPD